MTRLLTVLGAPSSIGIRPYDDGRMRRLDLAPSVLRELGLVAQLGARDDGDVSAPPYRDFVRPPGAIRNAAEVADYSRMLGDRVARATRDGAFVLLLGGDCSIVLGALLGVRGRGRIGLVYVDAHADFVTAEQSSTGSAAAACLALAVGRGEGPLVSLAGDGPLVDGADVALVGRRDDDDAPFYGQDALASHGILDLDHAALGALPPAEIAARALARVAAEQVAGFWVHLDADVFDPGVIPAVDSPEPGGLCLETASALLTPLVQHPKALGLQLTIYDPGLDPSRESARRLATWLQQLLAPV